MATWVHRFLSPKALALALAGLMLMAVMAWLGRWQFSVYDDHQHADAVAALRQPPVPLSSLLGRDEAFPAAGVSRPVVVAGRYIANQQVYVEGLSGADHRFAVVTPLLTDSGSAILVVRGSVPSPRASAPPGRVVVHGVLEPSQDPGRPVSPQRVTNRLSVAALVGAVGPDLYSGYVVMRASSPPQVPALTLVPPPLPDPSRWAGLRNLLYACQWWVFAGFVAFMWWRITGDLASSRREAEAPKPRPEADSGSLSPLG